MSPAFNENSRFKETAKAGCANLRNLTFKVLQAAAATPPPFVQVLFVVALQH